MTPPLTDTPLARYTAATSPGGWLSVDGWLRLAADLDKRADESGDTGIGRAHRAKLIDRAADCRDRAASLTRGAL